MIHETTMSNTTVGNFSKTIINCSVILKHIDVNASKRGSLNRTNETTIAEEPEITIIKNDDDDEQKKKKKKKKTSSDRNSSSSSNSVIFGQYAL